MEWTDIVDPTTPLGAVASIISGLVLLALWPLWRSIKGRLDRVLGQTENKHQDTEYPNLRDEVTAIRESVGDLVEMQKELMTTANADRTASRNETEGLRQDLRMVSGRVQEDVRNLTHRLDVHIAATGARKAPPSDVE